MLAAAMLGLAVVSYVAASLYFIFWGLPCLC